MNDYRRIQYSYQPRGIIGRVATVIVGATILIVSFFLGLFAFAVFAGLALILALVFGVRIWWAKRQLDKQFGQSGMHSDTSRDARPSPGHSVYDGEFREVRRERRD